MVRARLDAVAQSRLDAWCLQSGQQRIVRNLRKRRQASILVSLTARTKTEDPSIQAPALKDATLVEQTVGGLRVQRNRPHGANAIQIQSTGVAVPRVYKIHQEAHDEWTFHSLDLEPYCLVTPNGLPNNRHQSS
jgi:hypothetical protein